MKKLLLITGILFLLFSCATEKTNFGKLQDRNGLYYMVNEDKPFTGDVISYVNGKTEFEGTIQTGLREGKWVYYYPTGQKKMEGNFKDGVKDGTWTFWKENGQQDKIEIYKFGQLLTNEGNVQDSSNVDSLQSSKSEENQDQKSSAAQTVKKPEKEPEKKVEKKEQPVVWESLHGGPVKYLNGVPYTGPVVKYYNTGNKELEGYFVAGKRSGKWTYYDKFGNVKDVRYY